MTTPCRFYAQGRCKFGEECRFAHVNDNGTGATATSTYGGTASAAKGGRSAAPTHEVSEQQHNKKKKQPSKRPGQRKKEPRRPTEESIMARMEFLQEQMTPNDYTALGALDQPWPQQGLHVLNLCTLPFEIVDEDTQAGETCVACKKDITEVKNTAVLNLPCGHKIHSDCSLIAFKSTKRCPECEQMLENLEDFRTSLAQESKVWESIEDVMLAMLVKYEKYLDPEQNGEYFLSSPMGGLMEYKVPVNFDGSKIGKKRLVYPETPRRVLLDTLQSMLQNSFPGMPGASGVFRVLLRPPAPNATLDRLQESGSEPNFKVISMGVIMSDGRVVQFGKVMVAEARNQFGMNGIYVHPEPRTLYEGLLEEA